MRESGKRKSNPGIQKQAFIPSLLSVCSLFAGMELWREKGSHSNRACI